MTNADFAAAGAKHSLKESGSWTDDGVPQKHADPMVTGEAAQLAVLQLGDSYVVPDEVPEAVADPVPEAVKRRGRNVVAPSNNGTAPADGATAK